MEMCCNHIIGSPAIAWAGLPVYGSFLLSIIRCCAILMSSASYIEKSHQPSRARLIICEYVCCQSSRMENIMSQYQHVVQPFEPVYDQNSKILILGSFPSVKSRETGFYYGHKQNRFWRMLSAIFNIEEPVSIEEKKEMLLAHGIAVYDVIESCDIKGSSDSSIKNAVPADIQKIVEKADIGLIILNGGTASRLFQKYQQSGYTGRVITLPSTSPANAAFSLERLIELWGREIREDVSE